MKLNSLSACFLFGLSLCLQAAFAQSPPLSDETKALVRSNTEFGLAAYEKMGRNEGNLFFSPFSLSAALVMVYGGAKGETAKQIANVLHFHPNQKNVHAEMAALLKQMAIKDEQVQLFLANALWAQRDLPVLETYQTLLRTNYESELKTIDFAGNAQATAAAINDWAKQNTNGRIANIVQSTSFTNDTLLFLTNAVYFKARWRSEFGNTEAEDFWLNKTSKIKAQMMQQKRYFPYSDSGTFQMLELPYKDRLSMLILLPKDRAGLANIEKQLTAANLEKWLADLTTKEVDVFFPQFEMEANLSLKAFLANLGITLAFQDDADFSGVAKYNRGIKLDDAIQKTFVKVDEEGTEAVAVTALGAAAGAAFGQPTPPPPIIFRADHPFLFFIKENSTNTILFMGRVANPNQKQITFADQASAQPIGAILNTQPSPSVATMTNNGAASSFRNWGIGLGVLLAAVVGAFFAFKRKAV